MRYWPLAIYTSCDKHSSQIPDPGIFANKITLDLGDLEVSLSTIICMHTCLFEKSPDEMSSIQSSRNHRQKALLVLFADPSSSAM